MIKRLCIIGTGLIGGSLARSLRAADFCQEIVGAGRDRAHLDRAIQLGIIDRGETDISTAVKNVDMVVVAVPLGAMADMFAAIRDHVSDTVIITDVGSAKASVVADAAANLAERISRFVPGHPIAGTEKSGVEASIDDLFKDRKVILTPTDATDADATDSVRKLWQAVGAEVVEMTVEQHDKVLAATSHLPHLLAYSLVDTLAGMHEKDEVFQFAAGGFRDFTRIASSNPTMWRDICMANSDAILSVLESFNDDLNALAEAIRSGDADKVFTIFERAKQARDKYSKNSSS